MPIVLKHLGDTSLALITSLFKAIALLGKVPSSWMESKVILLAKPDKDTYAKPKSFRPISLMVFLLKVYEKLWL